MSYRGRGFPSWRWCLATCSYWSTRSKRVAFDADLCTLRFLLATGEALPAGLARRWFAVRGNIPLVNAYGPTECSDDVTHHIMRTPPAGETVPIGRAIRGVRLYVVDADLNQVVDGSEGELYVGAWPSAWVISVPAREQRRSLLPIHSILDRRPNSTAPAISSAASAKQLRYLGRIDQQVKVHGHRIELSEIEGALNDCPVWRVRAVAREDSLGHKQLAAYVAPSRNGHASELDLGGRAE